MRASLSLRRSFAAVLSGNVVYTGSQFVMLVTLARITSASEVGRYALALAITSPVFMLASLKLRQVQVTDTNGDHHPQTVFLLRLSSSVLAFSVAVLVCLIWGVSLSTLGTVAAVAAFKVVEAQVDTLYGILQRMEEMRAVAWSQALWGVLGAAAFSILVVFTGSAAFGAVGLTIVSLGPLFLVLRIVRNMGISVRVGRNVGDAWRLALLAFPLGVSVALGSLILNVPRYLLQLFEGEAQLGVFAAIGYLLVASNIVAGALAEAAMPRMSNFLRDGLVDQFRLTMRRLTGLGVLLGALGVCGALLLGAPVLGLIFGPAYAGQSDILVVLMLAGGLQYTTLFVGTAFNAMRMFKVQAPIMAVTLVGVVGAGVFLVPIFGGTGAAWSLVVAQSVQLVLYVFLYFWLLRPRLQAAAAGS